MSNLKEVTCKNKKKKKEAAAWLSQAAKASVQGEVGCGDLRNDSVVISAQTLASCVIHGAVPSGSYGSYLITMLMMFHRRALNCEHALTSLLLVSVLCRATLFLVVALASQTDRASPLPFDFLDTSFVWMCANANARKGEMLLTPPVHKVGSERNR